METTRDYKVELVSASSNPAHGGGSGVSTEKVRELERENRHLNHELGLLKTNLTELTQQAEEREVKILELTHGLDQAHAARVETQRWQSDQMRKQVSQTSTLSEQETKVSELDTKVIFMNSPTLTPPPPPSCHCIHLYLYIYIYKHISYILYGSGGGDGLGAVSTR